MLREGMDKALIVAVLEGYTHDINRIVALIPHKGAVKKAQSSLLQLKNAIHSDYKHRQAIVRSTQLTPLEQENLARAILDVFFVLQDIGVNTNPGTEWRKALFAADMDIQRCLAEFRGPEKRVESGATDCL